LQFNDDPPRTVAAVIKTDFLDLLAQFRVRLPRRVLIEVPVETGAANPRSITCL